MSAPLPLASPPDQPQTASGLDSLAAWLRAAGDPLRLLVLRVLAQDSFGVLELCQLLDIKQPALSHHLKLLVQAGLLTTRRERTTVFYRRDMNDSEAGGLKAVLLAQVDAQALPAEVVARFTDVQEQRSQASQRFFAENAARFAEQQELIAAFREYGPATAARAAELAAGGLALEIGPGEGELLPLLAQDFAQVVGLDLSAEMLAKARTRIAAAGLDNVRLIQGDTRSPQLTGLAPDVIVVNMVLHHLPRPEAMLADIAALLPAGGALLVTELCAHDQDWAREACGDVWLGFAPEALSAWATQLGLSDGRADYLALKNGFRIQIREFLKT